MRHFLYRLAGLLIAAIFALSSVFVLGQGVSTQPPAELSTGERELRAIAQAYPDRIESVELRDGDWALLMDGEWYYWAHGRILSEDERSNWERYSSFQLYRYPVGVLPPLPQFDEAAVALLKQRVKEQQENPPYVWEGFLERLMRTGTAADTDSQMRAVSFLGFRVSVHERIVSALKEAAADCQELRGKDPRVAAFFAGISEIDGFNYRDVAGTNTRSYHGYGLAVDLIPRSYANTQPYWRWAMERGQDWWAIPYDHRWMVPDSVIAAFERHGFVWGGKWLFFDTMHFEYRPEVIILATE